MEADPIAAEILQGRVLPDVELQVLSGQLPDAAPVVRSEAELRAEAIDAWVAAHPIATPEEQAAQTDQRAPASRQHP